MKNIYHNKLLVVSIVFLAFSVYDIISLVFSQSIVLAINNRLLFGIVSLLLGIIFISKEQERFKTGVPLLAVTVGNLYDFIMLYKLRHPLENFYVRPGLYSYNCSIKYKLFNVFECTYTPNQILHDAGLISDADFDKLFVQMQSHFNLLIITAIIWFLFAILSSQLHIKCKDEILFEKHNRIISMSLSIFIVIASTVVFIVELMK